VSPSELFASPSEALSVHPASSHWLSSSRRRSWSAARWRSLRSRAPASSRNISCRAAAACDPAAHREGGGAAARETPAATGFGGVGDRQLVLYGPLERKRRDEPDTTRLCPTRLRSAKLDVPGAVARGGVEAAAAAGGGAWTSGGVDEAAAAAAAAACSGGPHAVPHGTAPSWRFSSLLRPLGGGESVVKAPRWLARNLFLIPFQGALSLPATLPPLSLLDHTQGPGAHPKGWV
jgi:hypothetical protein